MSQPLLLAACKLSNNKIHALGLRQGLFALISLPQKMSVSSSRGNPDRFFETNKVFAVVGASNDTSKFGNKVFKCYVAHSKVAVPISKSAEIEGVVAYPTLTAFMEARGKEFPVDQVGVSLITPPVATAAVLQEGLALGIKSFFFQPGTTNEAVIKTISEREKGGGDINFVEGCVLVELGC